MAKFAATDVYVLINSTNISDWVFDVDTPDTKNKIDVSGFNPTGSQEYVPGSRDQSIALSIIQDFTNTTIVHGLLNPLYTSSTTFTVELRPTSAARSAANPWYGGTAQLYDYDGLKATLNARAEVLVTIRPSSGSVWAWATA